MLNQTRNNCQRKKVLLYYNKFPDASAYNPLYMGFYIMKPGQHNLIMIHNQELNRRKSLPGVFFDAIIRLILKQTDTHSLCHSTDNGDKNTHAQWCYATNPVKTR